MRLGHKREKIQLKVGQEKSSEIVSKWKSLPIFQNEKIWKLRLNALQLGEQEVADLFDNSKFNCSVKPKLLSLFNEIVELKTDFSNFKKDNDFFLDRNSLLQSLSTIKIHFYQELERVYSGIDFKNPKKFDRELILKKYFRSFARYITEELFPATLVTEMNVANKAGILNSQTADERFWEFSLGITSNPEWLTYYFEEYPVLLYRYYNIQENVLKVFRKVLESLDRDYDRIVEEFGIEPSDRIVTLEPFKGDLHNGCNSVHFISFESKNKVVYKPRSLQPEISFQNLLNWYSGFDSNLEFLVPKILDKGDYGWVEFIERRPCNTQLEIKRFYKRHGILLSLLQLLGATDILEDNVIACGEYPVLIDLECIMTSGEPFRAMQEEFLTEADDFFENSVLSTLLLPHWSFGNQNSAGVKTGALAIHDDKVFFDSPKWVDIGTDTMRKEVAKIERDLKSFSNVPLLNNKIEIVIDYKNEIIDGYSETCNFLILQRDNISFEEFPFNSFYDCKVRFIARPTNVYYQLRQEGLHPDYCKDIFETDLLYENLWFSLINYKNSLPATAIQSEIDQLWHEDIPYFFTYANTLNLYSGDGKLLIENFFSSSFFDSIKKRFDRLNENYVEQQIGLISDSLELLNDKSENFKPKAKHLSIETNGLVFEDKFEEFRRHAIKIGNYLLDMSIEDGKSIGWIGLSLAPGEEWQQSVLPQSLYDGSNGIALFLCYLSKYSNPQESDNFLRAAKKIVSRSFFEFDKLWRRHANNSYESPYIGVFDSPLDTLYVLSHIDHISNEEVLSRDMIVKFCDWVDPYIESDKDLDFMHGVCGLSKLLLNIHRQYEFPDALKLAERCGQHLLKNVSETENGFAWNGFTDKLGGFAHGTASYAWILILLYQETKNKEYLDAGMKGLEYDQSAFNSEKKAWSDFRFESKQICTAAWCHGSAGIGLSRGLINQNFSSEKIQQEMLLAMQHIERSGFGVSDCICHGDFGNAEILYALSKALNYNKYEEIIYNHLLESVQKKGKHLNWSGASPNIKSKFFGLFSGLAGNGYTLLRLLDWENVPSVLALESPLLEESFLHNLKKINNDPILL